MTNELKEAYNEIAQQPFGVVAKGTEKLIINSFSKSIKGTQPACWIAGCTFLIIFVIAIGILNFTPYMDESIEKTIWFIFGMFLLIFTGCIASAVIIIYCYIAGLKENLGLE